MTSELYDENSRLRSELMVKEGNTSLYRGEIAGLQKAITESNSVLQAVLMDYVDKPLVKQMIEDRIKENCAAL